MVSLRADHISLVYRLRRKLSLADFRSRLTNPDKRFSGQGRVDYFTALSDVSLALSAGDRLGLVGSNGAGKTTLLKVLAGIYTPTQGTIAIDGRIDALFNINLGFRPEATGRRNIELRGLLNGWSREQIAERSEAVIEFSGLGSFIDVPMKAYSQGMAARLAVSIATELEPEILLMDEWIGAGDPQFQEKISKRMDGIADRAGIIVLASHNLTLLKRISNKILHLEEGRVKSLTSAEEWFDNQENVSQLIDHRVRNRNSKKFGPRFLKQTQPDGLRLQLEEGELQAQKLEEKAAEMRINADRLQAAAAEIRRAAAQAQGELGGTKPGAGDEQSKGGTTSVEIEEKSEQGKESLKGNP